MGRLDGRVIVITGAGRGIGRSHALLMASEGARVVVNDLGTGVDGTGSDTGPAHEVAREIEELGGEAVASTHDVADWVQARGLIELAVETFGDVHVLVNNAGVIRDRTLAKMSEEEWDVTVRINLKGHAAPTKHAMAYWRDRARHASEPLDAAIIHTSSGSGFIGNFGQANYGAAKMGVVALSRIASLEGRRYGVRSNVIAPVATTRGALMLPGRVAAKPGEADPLDPARISPLAVWLASPGCPADSQLFHVYGKRIVVLEIARIAADLRSEQDCWSVEELDRVLPQYLVTPLDLRSFLPSTSPVARRIAETAS